MNLVCWRGFRAHPDNLPKRHPGVYRITHIETGKSYVGISRDVASRLGQHGLKQNSATKMKMALIAYGREAFIVEPLYYLLPGQDPHYTLHSAEASLIIDYDCIENGYNICEASPPYGPYGSKFSAILKIAQNRPGIKEKRAKTMARPEVKARWLEAKALVQPQMIEALRSYYSDPEIRKQVAQQQREAQLRPDVVAKKSAAAKANHKDPAYREKYEAYFNDKEKQAARLDAILSSMQRPDVSKKMRNRAPRNSTGVKGVYPVNNGSGHWRALITVNKKQIGLGSHFHTIAEAEAAYLAARKRYFGDDA